MSLIQKGEAKVLGFVGLAEDKLTNLTDKGVDFISNFIVDKTTLVWDKFKHHMNKSVVHPTLTTAVRMLDKLTNKIFSKIEFFVDKHISQRLQNVTNFIRGKVSKHVKTPLNNASKLVDDKMMLVVDKFIGKPVNQLQTKLTEVLDAAFECCGDYLINIPGAVDLLVDAGNDLKTTIEPTLEGWVSSVFDPLEGAIDTGVGKVQDFLDDKITAAQELIALPLSKTATFLETKITAPVSDFITDIIAEAQAVLSVALQFVNTTITDFVASGILEPALAKLAEVVEVVKEFVREKIADVLDAVIARPLEAVTAFLNRAVDWVHANALGFVDGLVAAIAAKADEIFTSVIDWLELQVCAVQVNAGLRPRRCGAADEDGRMEGWSQGGGLRGGGG